MSDPAALRKSRRTRCRRSGILWCRRAQTCYQALAGFCRHSAEIFPRFLADGTLVLRKEAAGSSIRLGSEILTAQYVRNRYGVAARQVLINTRNGSYQAADYAGFQALGGTRVQ